jgi:hypothetical protein
LILISELSSVDQSQSSSLREELRELTLLRSRREVAMPWLLGKSDSEHQDLCDEIARLKAILAQEEYLGERSLA